ncbi:hypothetical protein D3C76_479170 [compost metagenome]
MTKEERKDYTRSAIMDCLGLGYSPHSILDMLEDDEDADPEMVQEFKNAVELGLD